VWLTVFPCILQKKSHSHSRFVAVTGSLEFSGMVIWSPAV